MLSVFSIPVAKITTVTTTATNSGSTIMLLSELPVNQSKCTRDYIHIFKPSIRVYKFHAVSVYCFHNNGGSNKMHKTMKRTFKNIEEKFYLDLL